MLLAISSPSFLRNIRTSFYFIKTHSVSNVNYVTSRRKGEIISNPKHTVNSDSDQNASVDEFGKLAAQFDQRQRNLIHQSLKHRSFESENDADNLLLRDDGIEDMSILNERGLRVDRLNPRYVRRRNELLGHCRSGDADAALKTFFDGLLTHDRLIPSRFDCHRLLDTLVAAGRSEQSMRVFKKMKEVGIEPTQATYSRLFRACAEDSSAWFREHLHLFPLTTHGSPLSSLQRRKRMLVQKALSSEELFENFGGPGLKQAHRLWRHLRLKNVRPNQITFSSLLLALARGGDFQQCLRLLDQVGLPSSQNNLQSIEFTDYIITAVLSGIWTAVVKRSLAATLHPELGYPSSTNVVQLILTMWQHLLPHVGPSPSSHIVRELLTALQHVPHITAGSPSVLMIHPPAKTNHRLSDALEATDLLNSGTQPQSSLPSHELNGQADLCVQSANLDWDDPSLFIRSSVNLMLPSEQPIAIVSSGPWLPCHYLTLLGGIRGFLDTVELHYKSAIDIRLLTQVITFLPAPEKSGDDYDDEGSSMDPWESELFEQLGSRKIVPEVGFYNALIHRRSAAGLPTTHLLRKLTQSGLAPDHITWGSLARGCKTIDSVRRLLIAFGQASMGPNDSHTSRIVTVTPNLRFFASLFSANRFNWDVVAFLLRLMMGSEASDGVLTYLKTTDGVPLQLDPILPDKRLLASLDVDVGLFRQLVVKGLVPADGTARNASKETGGVPIPAYANAAFRRFLPVYKLWLRSSEPYNDNIRASHFV